MFIAYYLSKKLFLKNKFPILKKLLQLIMFCFFILYFWDSNLYSRFLIFAFWYLLSIFYL